MNVVVIGAGYVGLVSGSCLAEFGWGVTCIDTDVAKIAGLCNGEVPIYEPGLDTLVRRNMQLGSLRLSADLAVPVREADVVFLAVGTPQRHTTGMLISAMFMQLPISLHRTCMATPWL